MTLTVPHGSGASPFIRRPRETEARSLLVRRCVGLKQGMNKLTFFKVGDSYTNDQIRFSLDLENLGGIRPSLDSNRNVRHIAIMWEEFSSVTSTVRQGATLTCDCRYRQRGPSR